MPNELANFHAFVGEQLARGGDSLSPEDALDLWRDQHPDPAFEDATEEIREALEDMANGDRGRPIEEFHREFCQRNGIRRSL
jgi:hypothetical protein